MVRVLLSLIAAGIAQAQQRPAEQIFNRAAAALRQGDMAPAEAGFREVLRREPGNVAALANLGVVYSRQERAAEAISVYERALKAAPNEPGLLLNLGLAYLKLDQFAKAKPLFAQLVGTLRGPQAEELLAITRLQTGEVDAAVDALERLASAGSPPSAGVLHFLAVGYLKQGRKQDATAVLQRLFEVLPPARAHFLQGQALYEGTLFEQALEQFTRAAELDPALPGLDLAIGKAQVSLRNAEAAESHLRRALSANPHDLESRYFLGALLVQSGDPAAGLPLLEQVKQTRPDLWGTNYYLGRAKLALRRPLEAIPLLEAAAKSSPGEAPVLFQLARALQAAGRAAEARALFAKVGQMRTAAAAEPIVSK